MTLKQKFQFLSHTRLSSGAHQAHVLDRVDMKPSSAAEGFVGWCQSGRKTVLQESEDQSSDCLCPAKHIFILPPFSLILVASESPRLKSATLTGFSLSLQAPSKQCAQLQEFSGTFIIAGNGFPDKISKFHCCSQGGYGQPTGALFYKRQGLNIRHGQSWLLSPEFPTTDLKPWQEPPLFCIHKLCRSLSCLTAHLTMALKFLT